VDFSSQVRCPLPEEEYRLLRDFIAHYCGIWFDDQSRYLLERRLQKRLEEHGLDSFHDYYLHLIYSPDREEEVGIMLDILTTNETYFFREANQLKAFDEEVIPEIVSGAGTGERRIRIWSVGCSTGEEPYTLAILLMENTRLDGWHKEVLATDISNRVLHSAREGIYGKLAFRVCDPRYVERYFQKIDESRYRIKDAARSLVTFGHQNIMQSSGWPADAGFDVIFCRNLLIYFDTEAKKRAVVNLEKKLCRGGYLLLGHADSLLNVSTSFILRHFKHDMVYQKPGARFPG
jgi:chemotaxis protein methyltransferase CheR